MYRLLVETLLGINLEGTHLRIAPRLPKAWSTITIRYRYKRARYHITISKTTDENLKSDVLTLDGEQSPDGRIPLIDEDREHSVQLEICDNTA